MSIGNNESWIDQGNEDDILIKLILCLTQDEYKILIDLVRAKGYCKDLLLMMIPLYNKYSRKINSMNLVTKELERIKNSLQNNLDDKPTLKYDFILN